MTKKRAIIISVICILSLVIMTGFLIFSDNSKKIKNTNNTTETIAQIKESSPSEIRTKDLPAPSTAIIFKINSIKAGLVARKTFVKFADQDIMLSTSNINGHGWIDPSSKSYFLKANLDFSDFKDEKDKQNEELLKNLKDKNIYLEVYVEDENIIDLQNEVKLQVPVLLTINNVTRNEIFTLDMIPDSNNIQVTGDTEINLSDYQITPPVSKDVYSYEDNVKLYYEFSGTII